MPAARTTIRIFVGSPSDVDDDHGAIISAADEINSTRAHDLGVHFDVVDWKDVLPGPGRPQSRINETIRDSDLVVLLLWRRWGTPSGRYSSRFHEEYELSVLARKYVALYFREISTDLLADPGNQLKAVLRFKREIERADRLLYATYRSKDHLERIARRHLADWLSKWCKGTLEPRKIAHSLPGFQPLGQMTKVMPDQEVMTPAFIWADVAETLVEEAHFRLDAGAPERAGELFAKALAVFPSAHTLHGFQRYLNSQGRHSEARPVRAALRKLASASKDPITRVFALEGEGNALNIQGDLDGAHKAFTASGRLSTKHGFLDGAITAENHLGTIARTRGHANRAIKHYNRAIELAVKGGNLRAKAASLVLKSSVLMMADRPQDAWDTAKEAEELCVNLGLTEERLRVHMTMVSLLAHSNHLDRALELVRKDVEVARKIGNPSLTCFLLSYEGNCLAWNEDIRGAITAWEEADAIASMNVGVELQGQIAVNLGSAYMSVGDGEKGRAALHRAQELFRRIGRVKLATFARRIKAPAEGGARKARPNGDDTRPRRSA